MIDSVGGFFLDIVYRSSGYRVGDGGWWRSLYILDILGIGWVLEMLY